MNRCISGLTVNPVSTSKGTVAGRILGLTRVSASLCVRRSRHPATVCARRSHLSSICSKAIRCLSAYRKTCTVRTSMEDREAIVVTDPIVVVLLLTDPIVVLLLANNRTTIRVAQR